MWASRKQASGANRSRPAPRLALWLVVLLFNLAPAVVTAAPLERGLSAVPVGVTDATPDTPRERATRVPGGPSSLALLGVGLVFLIIVRKLQWGVR